jgi:hypothetical protein
MKRATPPKAEGKKKITRKLNAPAAGPNAPDVADLEKLEVYYDTASKGYFVKAEDGDFIPVNKDDISIRLQLTGLSASREGTPSQVDETLVEIQSQAYVRYAGPLAGWPAQRYDISGKAVLVTESPVIIEPTDGHNTTIRDYVERLLGATQAADLHAWLKTSYESLLAGNLRRAPAMCIVGERDQGKSLLINSIIVPLLGGRQARPQQYMTGQTTFNLDLIGSEVLVMDDPGSDDHYATRKRFGDAIKALTGDQAPRCHGKGMDALTLTPFWRLVIAMNDELEDLQVLPPMTKSMFDKITILKTVGRAVDRKTASTADFAMYGAELTDGLGDYLGWLDHWMIPADLISDRWGVRARQHPEVLEALHQFSPEEKLWEFIQEEILPGVEEPKAFTAREIEALLTNSMSSVAQAASHLLRSAGSIGKYMSRLPFVHPESVQFGNRGGGQQHYIITTADARLAKQGQKQHRERARKKAQKQWFSESS